MKGKSIAHATTIFLVFILITVMIPGVRSLIRWENRWMGGSFFTGGVMIILTVVSVIINKMDFEDIGIRFKDWRKSLNMGFKGFLIFLPVQLVLTMAWAWGVNYKEDYQIAALLGGIVYVVTFLLMGNLGKNRGEISKLRMGVIVVILSIPLVLGFVLDTVSIKLFTSFIWQILVGGFIEELFFRGLIQSMVNKEYGTHWRFRGVSYGPGLLVSSVLYGLSRGLRGMNIGWGIYAFTLGIFYGFIREASGDIIGSGSANAMIDGFGATLFKVMF